MSKRFFSICILLAKHKIWTRLLRQIICPRTSVWVSDWEPVPALRHGVRQPVDLHTQLGVAEQCLPSSSSIISIVPGPCSSVRACVLASVTLSSGPLFLCLSVPLSLSNCSLSLCRLSPVVSVSVALCHYVLMPQCPWPFLSVPFMPSVPVSIPLSLVPCPCHCPCVLFPHTC